MWQGPAGRFTGGSTVFGSPPPFGLAHQREGIYEAYQNKGIKLSAGLTQKQEAPGDLFHPFIFHLTISASGRLESSDFSTVMKMAQGPSSNRKNWNHEITRTTIAPGRGGFSPAGVLSDGLLKMLFVIIDRCGRD